MTEKTNHVESATEIVKSIPEFFDAVSELLQTPFGWIILLALLIWFLINKDLNNIFSVFERGEKRRLEKLEQYVTNQSAADDEALKVIKDLRDAHYFKVATTIYAEKCLRNALIKLHNKTSHIFNWTQIKRALVYFDVKPDLSISIRERNWWEKAGHYYNNFIGTCLLFFSAVVFVAFSVSQTKTIETAIVGIGGSVGCALFAMFVFSQNWPYISAKKIKAKLLEMGNEQSQDPEAG